MLCNRNFRSTVSSPHLETKKSLLNKIPFANTSRRSYISITHNKNHFKNLKQKQIQLKNHFSLINSEQRLLTAKIVSAREKHIDTIIEKVDSFNERYSPSKHKFFHKLIGEVQLPRKFFNIIPQEKELEQIRNIKHEIIKEDIKPVEITPKVEQLHRLSRIMVADRFRKALSSIKHYKEMKIDSMIIPKLNEYLPGVPYGLPKSKEFLNACKEGNLEAVIAMIELNK